MIRKILMALLAIPLLHGCASYAPIPENYKGPVVTIKDTHQPVSPTKVYFFELSKVDGRDVETSSQATYEHNYGQGFIVNSIVRMRGVPATPSTLDIQGVTHYGAPILALAGENPEVRGTVTVDLQPGEVYSVRGELSMAHSAVWVENSKGEIVSEKIETGAFNTPISKSTLVQDAKAKQQATPGDTRVVIFNTAGALHTIDDTSRLTISLDGDELAVLRSREFTQVYLPRGDYELTLTHWDVFTFSSSHNVTIEGDEVFLDVSPTILSNSLTVGDHLPEGYTRTPKQQ